MHGGCFSDMAGGEEGDVNGIFNQKCLSCFLSQKH